MLMAVEEDFGMSARDVSRKTDEPDVNVVFAIVDEARGIMSYKDVNVREGQKGLLDFGLLEQIVSFWFVFPRATESSESQTSEVEGCALQIPDSRCKARAGIVVSFNGQGFPATARGGDLQDNVVRQVTAGNKHVCASAGNRA